MLRGKALDATVIYQAGERSLHGPVPIGSHGMAVDFPPCGERLSRGAMYMAGVTDLPVHMARPIVANQAQWLSVAPHQRQATGKVQIVIQVLALVDPADLPVFRYGAEIPLLMAATPFQSAGIWNILTCLSIDCNRTIASFDRNKPVIGRWTATDCQRFSGIARQTGPPRASSHIATTPAKAQSLEAQTSFSGQTPPTIPNSIFVPLSQPVTPSVSATLLRRDPPLGPDGRNSETSRLMVRILRLRSFLRPPHVRDSRPCPAHAGPQIQPRYAPEVLGSALAERFQGSTLLYVSGASTDRTASA